MKLNYKLPKAFLCNNGICLPQSFMIVEDISCPIILGVPFMHAIFPLKRWDHTKIIGTYKDKDFQLDFITKPFTKSINQIVEKLILKNQQVNFIKQEIS